MQVFKKYSYIKFYVILLCWSRVVPHGRTDGQRAVMKLIVAFPSFMKSPANTVCCCCFCSCCYCHNFCCCEEILFKFVTYNLKVYSTTMFEDIELSTVCHT